MERQQVVAGSAQEQWLAEKERLAFRAKDLLKQGLSIRQVGGQLGLTDMEIKDMVCDG
jgi:hypothetical protein